MGGEYDGHLACSHGLRGVVDVGRAGDVVAAVWEDVGRESLGLGWGEGWV